jgi:hypothetical protein
MKSASQMKSPAADIKTDLISSRPQGFDFIQICLDFIVNKVNDFIIESFKLL